MSKPLAPHRRIPLTRAEYYPPEAEVGDDEMGIVEMRATHLDVTPCIHEDGQVTLGARADHNGDPLSYELDLTPDTARQLARLLERAAAAAEPGTVASAGHG